MKTVIYFALLAAVVAANTITNTITINLTASKIEAKGLEVPLTGWNINNIYIQLYALSPDQSVYLSLNKSQTKQCSVKIIDATNAVSNGVIRVVVRGECDKPAFNITIGSYKLEIRFVGLNFSYTFDLHLVVSTVKLSTREGQVDIIAQVGESEDKRTIYVYSPTPTPPPKCPPPTSPSTPSPGQSPTPPSPSATTTSPSNLPPSSWEQVWANILLVAAAAVTVFVFWRRRGGWREQVEI